MEVIKLWKGFILEEENESGCEEICWSHEWMNSGFGWFLFVFLFVSVWK
jgi:hypothetical protein